MASDKVKKALREYFKDIVIPELKAIRVKITEPTTGIYKCVYGTKIVEFYPSSGKYFDITNQVRGSYNGTVEDTIRVLNARP